MSETELDLHTWLQNWIRNTSDEEVRGKFSELVGTFLQEEDVAYIFYNLIVNDHPDEKSRLDSILEGLGL
jgi:hypothetical protein